MFRLYGTLLYRATEEGYIITHKQCISSVLKTIGFVNAKLPYNKASVTPWTKNLLYVFATRLFSFMDGWDKNFVLI